MASETEVVRDQPRRGQRLILLVLVVGLLLACFVVLLLAGFFAARGAVNRVGSSKSEQLSQIHRAFAGVNLPPGYALEFNQDSGDVGPLSDQPPAELRIYRLNASANTPDALRRALNSAGFTPQQSGRCVIEAVRGAIDVSVLFMRRDPLPSVNGGPSQSGSCPTRDWKTAYAWMVIGHSEPLGS